MKDFVLGSLLVFSLALAVFAGCREDDNYRVTQKNKELIQQLHAVAACCQDGCCCEDQCDCCPCDKKSATVDPLVQSGLDYGFLVYDLNIKTGSIELFWAVQTPFGQQLLPTNKVQHTVPIPDEPPATGNHSGAYDPFGCEGGTCPIPANESCGNPDCDCPGSCPCPHPCPCERK